MNYFLRPSIQQLWSPLINVALKKQGVNWLLSSFIAYLLMMETYSIVSQHDYTNTLGGNKYIPNITSLCLLHVGNSFIWKTICHVQNKQAFSLMLAAKDYCKHLVCPWHFSQSGSKRYHLIIFSSYGEPVRLSVDPQCGLPSNFETW